MRREFPGKIGGGYQKKGPVAGADRDTLRDQRCGWDPEKGSPTPPPGDFLEAGMPLPWQLDACLPTQAAQCGGYIIRITIVISRYTSIS